MIKLHFFTSVVAAGILSAGVASAGPITWNQWSTSFTQSSTAGSASGSAGSVGVTYTGELENLFFGYPSWGPSSTFSGGTVGNGPAPADGIVQLYGGGTTVDTITFSKPVTNPVMAIWSLGQGGITANFTFTGSEPFTIESGGPSNEYNGSSIYASGNQVLGAEGNGVIQFNGTFTSLTWTNTTYENWYGFDVGVPGVPEPATWALMLAGFGLSGLALRRRRAPAAT